LCNSDAYYENRAFLNFTNFLITWSWDLQDDDLLGRVMVTVFKFENNLSPKNQNKTKT